MSANDAYILDLSDSDPRAYCPVEYIVGGVGVHQGGNNCSSSSSSSGSSRRPNRPCIVRKGDSILLFDGTIWQVEQPLVCTFDGSFAVDAKKVGASCENVCCTAAFAQLFVLALVIWIGVCVTTCFLLPCLFQFIPEDTAPDFTVGNLAEVPDGACLVLTELFQIIPASQIKGEAY